MKKIQLSKSRKGESYTAIIDDKFYEIASKYRWYCNVISDIPYGATNIKINNWRYRKELLHRMAYEHAYGKLPPKARITFIDGNSLNCTSKNLHVAGISNDTDGRSKFVSKHKLVVK